MNEPVTPRRTVLKQMAGIGAAMLAPPALAQGADSAVVAPANAIVTENARAGTRDWMLSKTGVDPATKYRCPWIEGYCSKSSVRPGETITFHVSTNPVSEFTLSIYRLGYYGGDGGRLMAELGPFPGKTQPDPDVGPKRLRDCHWEPCQELYIHENWLSGVYVGKLTALDNGWQSYVIFVVRDDRQADYLFQVSDNTWQAYNRWPSQFSLYDDGQDEWYWGGGVQVSFNRPYGKYCQILDAPLSIGSGEFFLWEFPLAYWMESLGCDVTYASNIDTHQDPLQLLRAKGLISIGHDEYWSIEMFQHVKRAIDSGVNVAFLSGNAICGRIQFDPTLRAFERVGVYGPPGGMRDFVAMKSLAHERPYANELIGAHSTGPVTGGADWICNLPDHWLYAGTGMKLGDRVPGVIGWEWHGDPAPIPGLEIVATGATQSAPGTPNEGVYTATVYPGPKNNFVFNAATCWWADGLSVPPGYVRPKVYTEPQGPDPRLQQITKNVLDRMRA
ncbi:MAG: DUF6605 domain-containing protein [Planctomycetia bacterium]|nr:DUF6605 domain-containing protein [Planctomycetia bacterium]